MTHRVVVTGIGVCSPIGNGKDTFWQRCQNDQTNVAHIPETWKHYGTLASDIWSPLPELKWGESLTSRIEDKQLDPVSIIGIHAAGEALQDAGINKTLNDPKRNTYELGGVDDHRVGVFVGTGVGGIHTIGQGHSYQVCSKQMSLIQDLSQKVSSREDTATEMEHIESMKSALHFPKRFNPFTVSMLMPNACAANIAIKFGIKGPNRTVALACASGTAAIGEAFRSVSSGAVDLAIAGGAEYLFDDYGTIFRGFDIPRTLANNYESKETANRPFDKKRSGFLFSQGGAAFVVLERETAARSRQADVHCSIAGYGESCDARSIMSIDPEGTQIKRMLSDMLNSSGVSARDVNYVNSHGTGTMANDEVESKIIDQLFSDDVVINSTKALVGHTIGAAGALEAVVTALSLKDQVTHGHPNLEYPICDLNYKKAAGSIRADVAISQSFGFGGHNTALVMTRQ